MTCRNTTNESHLPQLRGELDRLVASGLLLQVPSEPSQAAGGSTGASGGKVRYP